MSVTLKAELRNRLEALLDDEFPSYEKALLEPASASIRVNTLKIQIECLQERLEKKGFKLRSIPWFRDAFYVSAPTRGLGKTLEHVLGYYYVQGAASMLPPVALGPEPGMRVLDLCAAPGSKTTQMAQMMDNRGIIIANDVMYERLAGLHGNLERCGVSNTVVVNMDGREFSSCVKQRFDRVLVDAPCSGSGIIRNKPSVGREWSVETVNSFSGLQKQLLLAGFDSLRDGGVLVYSTCSLDPLENESVVDLVSRRDDSVLLDIEIEGIKTRRGLGGWDGVSYHGDIGKCVRVYPHDNDSIGFFFAKVRRVEG